MSGFYWALLVLVAVAVLTGCGLAASRWHTLTRRVGSFPCGLTIGDRSVSGVAHYGARSLYWWRLRSLALRAERIWPRDDMTVVERHALQGGRALSGPILVSCQIGSERVQLVMSPEAYAGLTSWLESAPPVPHTVI